ncbi:MAG: D-alanyl-D-alanine carboxypeptidase family protein [Lachnospiraceae bacterium]
MRCINKYWKIFCICILLFAVLTGCKNKTEITLNRPYSVVNTMELLSASQNKDQTITAKNQSQDQALSFASKNLCVAADENTPDDPSFDTSTAEVVGIMDTGTKQILYQKNIFQKMYPASTTKIMTAYLAIKYGKLDDLVTVKDDVLTIPGDASKCYLKPGDTLTLEQLLYGLMLKSGNDAALAIADHISGDVASFVDLMNKEAKTIGATHTHFVNPHGLHDEEHYTTAYDLYLMFQTALQQEEFCKLIQTSEYETQYTDAQQKSITAQWSSTNRFLTGETPIPEGIKVLGGKTGTTDVAGHCDILYSQNVDGSYRISVVMKADTKDNMYNLLSQMLTKTE